MVKTGTCEITIHLSNETKLYLQQIQQFIEAQQQPINPSEAIFAFMGWLTTRHQAAGPFSRSHNASQAAELCREFTTLQNWDPPREGFHHHIKPFTN